MKINKKNRKILSIAGFLVLFIFLIIFHGGLYSIIINNPLDSTSTSLLENTPQVLVWDFYGNGMGNEVGNTFSGNETLQISVQNQDDSTAKIPTTDVEQIPLNTNFPVSSVIHISVKNAYQTGHEYIKEYTLNPQAECKLTSYGIATVIGPPECPPCPPEAYTPVYWAQRFTCDVNTLVTCEEDPCHAVFGNVDFLMAFPKMGTECTFGSICRGQESFTCHNYVYTSDGFIEGRCGYSPETCTDGIQNQDETGIDCGGICQACSDGKITVFRLSNNNCTELRILPADRTTNDYDTLALCQDKIPNNNWIIISLIVLVIIILIIGLTILYLKTRRR